MAALTGVYFKRLLTLVAKFPDVNNMYSQNDFVGFLTIIVKHVITTFGLKINAQHKLN